MWLLHPNFKKVFSFFGLIPFITSAFLCCASYILAIVDGVFGIIFGGIEIGFIRFVLWIILGVVATVICYCLMVLLMSPMMAKFDAIMDIRNKVLGEEVPKVSAPEGRAAKPRTAVPVRKRPELEIFDGSVTPPPVRTAPPRTQAPQPTQPTQPPKQPLETHWICPSCNKKNLRIMTKCVYCDTERK